MGNTDRIRKHRCNEEIAYAKNTFQKLFYSVKTIWLCQGWKYGKKSLHKKKGEENAMA